MGPNTGLREPRGVLFTLALAVGALRVATLPKSFWEFDEFLFAAGVRHFDPLIHRPHPPGYPLLIGLGKLFTALSLSPFHALLVVTVLSSALGAPLLAGAIRRLASPLGERLAWQAGIAGALLFHGSAAMLVQGALPMSDPPALLFLSLALFVSGEMLARPIDRYALVFAIACSATIGCRPQMAVSVLPLFAVTLILAARRARSSGTAARIVTLGIAGFAAASLAWFLPLVVKLGGARDLLRYESRHAAGIAGESLGNWRQHWTPSGLVTRFVAHPWGPAWLSLPILLLAMTGAVYLLRRNERAIWPWLTLLVVHLAFCLLTMEPADGVRYGLPIALVVAGLAAVAAYVLVLRLAGEHRAPWLAALVPTSFAAGALLYAGPLLIQRGTTLSPPAQAVVWARQELSDRAIFLVARDLAPHADTLLAGRFCLPLERTLDFYPMLPKREVYLFVEGKCPWGRGKTFEWPPSDAFGKLTRNHYRVVSMCELDPSRRFIAVRGISPLELGHELAWWWLADESELAVRPRGATGLRLSFSLPQESPIASTVITARIDGQPIGALTLVRGVNQEIELPLPENHRLDDRLDITLSAGSSFVPSTAEGGPVDRRHLAAELLELELKYPSEPTAVIAPVSPGAPA